MFHKFPALQCFIHSLKHCQKHPIRQQVVAVLPVLVVVADVIKTLKSCLTRKVEVPGFSSH